MFYMKHSLNGKKTIVPVSNPKSKKTVISVKTSLPVKKKTIVSAPKIKLTKVETADLVIKSKTKKKNASTPIKKTEIAQAKKASNTSARSVKSNENSSKSRVSDVLVKTKIVKPQTVITVAKNAKSQRNVSAKINKFAEVQPIAAKKSKVENLKSVFIKPEKIKIAVNKNIKIQEPKSFDTIADKNQKLKVSDKKEIKFDKIKAVHLVKKINLPAEKIAPKNAVMPGGKISKRIKAKPFEVKIEPQVLPLPPKPKKKKAKAISSAIFRGKKERYDFTVFPLDAEFEEVPAIYIISRRIVDKNKKAHHALVCIGQTESLLSELKKHKKDKCARKYAANSISLLREENERKRLKIETDLKAAHTIPCVHT